MKCFTFLKRFSSFLFFNSLQANMQFKNGIQVQTSTGSFFLYFITQGQVSAQNLQLITTKVNQMNEINDHFHKNGQKVQL